MRERVENRERESERERERQRDRVENRETEWERESREQRERESDPCRWRHGDFVRYCVVTEVTAVFETEDRQEHRLLHQLPGTTGLHLLLLLLLHPVGAGGCCWRVD